MTIPTTFADLYAQWRSTTRATKGEPLLAFVTWVETTLGVRICDLATESEMDALRIAFGEHAKDPDAGEMIFQGLEGGP